MSISRYSQWIQDSLDYTLKHADTLLNEWKSNIQHSELFGYSPTVYPANIAEMCGAVYQQTGNPAVLHKAIEMLLIYKDIKTLFPADYYKDRVEFADGLPPIADFISMFSYPRAYLYIKETDALSDEQRRTIEQGVADCANHLMHFPEWGPMNRAAIRAETLQTAVLALPDHPDRSQWQQMARVLRQDNYQRWEEEDATGYLALWMHSMMRQLDLIGDTDFYRSALPRFYLDYFTHLITPNGTLADFGDAVWYSDWFLRFIPIFERGAAIYREPRYRWAALQVLDGLEHTDYRHMGFYGPTNFLVDIEWIGKPLIANPYNTLAIIDAARWADESLQPEAPSLKSTLVMEDVIGKKIVFRDPEAEIGAYLFLNYKDEGDGNLLGRDYLRQTLCVEEEKMHHGHSDENSVGLLMYNGSVLLHDSGYRDRLPSSEYGGYRADVHHNRMVVRNNKRWKSIDARREEQSLWEFLRNSGAYRPVTTQLVDFLRFDRVDMSRTRLVDPHIGYQWDRSIFYQKQDQFFVIVDALKARREDYFTWACLWHTQKLLASGDRWFDTTIESILNYENPAGNNLLIAFPLEEPVRSQGSFSLRRHSQDEIALYQTLSDHYYSGETEVFVSVLIPHRSDRDAETLARQIQLMPTDAFPRAVGVSVSTDSRTDYFGVKTDMQMDLIPQNIRPRYQTDRGTVSYGPFKTDAHLWFGSIQQNTLYTASSLLTRMHYHNMMILDPPEASFAIQLDGSGSRSGRSKWRSWEDTKSI